MSGTDRWRGSSDWRTRDSASSAARNPPKNRETYDRQQGRLGASSWRARGVPNDAESRNEQYRERNSRPVDRERKLNRSPAVDESTTQAINEGRRIYIGNLRYQAKPDDIEALLKANELLNFTSIHISIDPFTGRNPSYCFVEFQDRESADQAMITLEGKMLLNRPVKCRPCIPKGANGQDEGLNRWGRWPNRETEGASSGSNPQQADTSSPPVARYEKDYTGKRLYVGGLPRMLDQATNSAEMRDIFKGFEIEAISKRVSAHESVRAKPGNHDFCFVDFATPEQAQSAMDFANGRPFRGGRLRISCSSGRSKAWKERQDLKATLGEGGSKVIEDIAS